MAPGRDARALLVGRCGHRRPPCSGQARASVPDATASALARRPRPGGAADASDFSAGYYNPAGLTGRPGSGRLSVGMWVVQKLAVNGKDNSRRRARHRAGWWRRGHPRPALRSTWPCTCRTTASPSSRHAARACRAGAVRHRAAALSVGQPRHSPLRLARARRRHRPPSATRGTFAICGRADISALSPLEHEVDAD